MKLLRAKQIAAWDRYTIEHEPVSSLNLMERAAQACIPFILNLLKSAHTKAVTVFCGPGNNGGDGLAIARILHESGVPVQVFVLETTARPSADFAQNLKRLPVTAQYLKAAEDFPKIQDGLVVDALYGTGLSRPLSGISALLVEHINRSQATVLAVDLPSGLMADASSPDPDPHPAIIKATHTLTFQVPKACFMHAEYAPYSGDFTVLDIGLDRGYLSTVADEGRYFFTSDDAKQLLQPRPKFAHKGTFGHVLTVGGSYGKIGAAVLMSRAALRTGCGLVTAFVPKVGYTILQTAFPEAMVETDEELYEIRNFPNDLAGYDALCIGPGMGRHSGTRKSFEAWLPRITPPCVLDADALNLCAEALQEHPDSFAFPHNAILTPHPKEFDRMAGPSVNSFERLEKQIRFAQRYGVVVVVKGAHSATVTPDGDVFFNASGNVAMATAGSGDALSGIIASLLAQGYSTRAAACLGVFVHGLAGDLATQNKSTLIASDIIEKVPEALYAIGRY